MFIRILQGRVADPAGVRAELERWRREVAPDVPGWQRLTAGVTEDRELVALFRYAGRATAGIGLAGQAAWERAVGRHLDGPATWHDCTQVYAMKGGDADDAGFVQVVQGRLADPVRLAAARVEVERTLRERAPHVLGVLVAEHADEPGGFTEVSYVTSRHEARAAERAMPVDVAVQLGMVRSYVEGLRFVELREVLLARPAVPVP
ncbi:MAG TPA: hypothetical protein VFD04_12635 [Actinomycetes bacterium]|nr:hypothetical protein [Actinomycetes bacterium]